MITVLTIDKQIPKKWHKRVLSFIFGSNIKTQLIDKNGIQVVNIHLQQTTNKIPWRRISSYAGYGKEKLLCNQDIKVPNKYGLCKFYSKSFDYRLCENAAIIALKKANLNPQNVKISLYDPDCRHLDMAEQLLPYCSNLKIITNNEDLYIGEADRLMDEYGASILVGRKVEWLYTSDVLIAPEKLSVPIRLKNNAVIFTAEKPDVFVKGVVYYTYGIKLPSEYNDICPKGLDPKSFLSYLYSECGTHQLGAIVPKFCRGFSKTSTIDEVARYIGKMMT